MCMNLNGKAFRYFLLIGMLLNSALLAWLWLRPRSNEFPGQPHGPEYMAIQLLGLDQAQQRAFHESARHHHQSMMRINEERVSLFLESTENLATDSLSAETQANLLRLEQERWRATRQHFSEVKALLKPEQLPRFDGFCEAVLKGPGRPRR